MQIGNAPVTAYIVTTFRFDEALHIDVPGEMRSSYIDVVDGRVDGVATYGNFRRFEVRTREAIGKP